MHHGVQGEPQLDSSPGICEPTFHYCLERPRLLWLLTVETGVQEQRAINLMTLHLRCLCQTAMV